MESIEIGSSLINRPNSSYSINTDIKGYVDITYIAASGVGNSYINPIITVTFKSLVNEENNTPVKFTSKNLYDSNLTELNSNTVNTNIYLLYEEEPEPIPKLTLESYDGYDKDFIINLLIEKGKNLAAGDFTISYNKNIMNIKEITSPTGQVIANIDNSNGLLRFSYINENGLGPDEEVVVSITITPSSVIDTYLSIGSRGLVDSSFKSINVEIVNSHIKTNHELIHHDRLDPTCTEDGYEEYDECANCGSSTYTVINKLGHNYVDTIVSPTCTAKGYTIHHCSRCDDEYIDSYTDMVPHTESDWIIDTDPTCTEEGLMHKKCIVCGATTTTTTINALGHQLSDWIIDKNPTCTETGNRHKECLTCHETIQQEVVPALGHNYVDTIVEPTCTAKGYTIHHCSRCGDEYIDSYTDMIPHTESHWIIDSEPTCTELGHRHKECTECHTLLFEENIAELGHNYLDTIVDPTCTAKGYTVHHCSRCDDEYIDSYTDMVPHTESDWIVDSEGSCTELGHKHKECIVCHIVLEETESIIEHSYSDWITDINPTCTEPGHKYIECTRCHLIYSEETLSPLGHDYVNTIVNPTCTEQGYTIHHCSRCDDEYIDNYKDALGHKSSDWIIDNYPTCTNKGHKHKECTVCGEALVEEDIPALGHSYVDTVVSPTCTTNGYTIHRCSICNNEYTDSYIDALGHILSDWIIDLEPTCTENGSMHKECSRCGETVTVTSINALGHIESDWIIDKNPSCQEEGRKHIECTRCHIVLSNTSIERIEHSLLEWETTKEPTYTENGMRVQRCSLCGDIINRETITKLAFTNEMLNFQLYVSMFNPNMPIDVLFNNIKECFKLHQNFDNLQKEAVRDDFSILLQYVNRYNNLANERNDKFETDNGLAIGIISTTSLISLAGVAIMIVKKMRYFK